MVDIVNTPSDDDIIVDIRHPDEIQIKPLVLTQTILQIPFYQIQSLREQLDSNKRYLLYCEMGTMSRIQAELMKEKGFLNVHVLK